MVSTANTRVMDAAKALLAFLAAILVAMTIWAAISTATTGGWWIPAGQGYGSDGGYWLLIEPTGVEAHPGYIHYGSEAVAAGRPDGSVGRLQDFGGDDRRSSICDNYANFSNAMAFVRRWDRGDPSRNTTKSHRTYDSNGVKSGCGVDLLDFSGMGHSAFEDNLFHLGSAESIHTGF